MFGGAGVVVDDVLLLQVFSDQLLLQDVLARSDRAMAVVKDLFGDAPRRQSGRNTVLNRHVTMYRLFNILSNIYLTHLQKQNSSLSFVLKICLLCFCRTPHCDNGSKL